jgi:hypothetical protein
MHSDSIDDVQTAAAINQLSGWWKCDDTVLVNRQGLIHAND